MAAFALEVNPVQPPASSRADGTVLLMLPRLAPEAFEQAVANLSRAFHLGDAVVVAQQSSVPSSAGGLRFIAELAAPAAPAGWSLRALDFARAARMCRQQNAHSVLLLGPGAESVTPETLLLLANGVLHADVVAPRYRVPANAGLLQSGLLYPFSRALFGSSERAPLPLDVGLSSRAAERLGGLADDLLLHQRPEALLWPAIEAKVAGMDVLEFDGGTRLQPQPEGDLNRPFAQSVGSLFVEAETHAAFWQTLRTTSDPIPLAAPQPTPLASMAAEAARLTEAFRLGCTTLWDIWSLVVPPQSLDSLRRLSNTSIADFVMPPALWARIVYDFLLAHRLRTIHRRHLLGALTPLYLAWVASHLRRLEAGLDAEQEVDALARSFEQARPYLVSRWRWPDRWNP